MSFGRTDHRNDEGSVAAVVPIFLLLVIAGMAALVGIALQPTESEAVPSPVVTSAKLGAPCSEQVGPIPSGQAAAGVWAQSLVDCVNDRIGAALGSPLAQSDAGYRGVEILRTFEGSPRFIIRWEGEAPTALVAWSARYPNGLLAVDQADAP